MSTKLSAVTATRNRADLLARCIKSVAAQTHPDKEHVIIDGASTDGTLDLLRAASSRYPHIRWKSEPDDGLSQALNKGLALVTGAAVAIIGDDDFYERDAFAKVAAEFERNPNVGLIAGGCRMIRNDGSEHSVAKAAFTTHSDLVECWRYWWKRVALPAPSTFMTKVALDQVGGFDERDKYAMDFRHWIKITERFDVRILDTVLANVRFDEGTISFGSGMKQLQEAISISKDYWRSPINLSYYRFLSSYLIHYRLPLLWQTARKAAS